VGQCGPTGLPYGSKGGKKSQSVDSPVIHKKAENSILWPPFMIIGIPGLSDFVAVREIGGGEEKRGGERTRRAGRSSRKGDRKLVTSEKK